MRPARRCNLPLAGLLSAIQLACTLALTVAYGQIGSRLHVPLAPRLQGEGLKRPKSVKERLAVGLTIAVLTVLLVTPPAALGRRSAQGALLHGLKHLRLRESRASQQLRLAPDYYRDSPPINQCGVAIEPVH